MRWRESGELSLGNFKRTAAARATRRMIPPLLHPNSQTISTTKEEMLDAAAIFYFTLYSPDSVDLSSIDSLLRSLLENLYLSETAQTMLISPITYDGILEGVSHFPKRSSPVVDGLPYEILRIIICPSSLSGNCSGGL
ncbi:hypothetical protein RMATCC62417_13110 [Rhizopus microsporus]|nr:hypothetical protein RMATCC62417_13110 [Rhizopus microsporus]